MSGELLFALVLTVFAVLALVVAYRVGAGAHGRREIVDGMAGLRVELERLARQHERLHSDVQFTRERSQIQLAEAASGIRGDLGEARRALAEVQAFGEGWSRDLASTAQSLRRVEAVFAGSSSRGAAGEHALASSLAQLPADMLENNVAFGSRVVEYAVRLPGGRLLPVDSKWPGAGPIERLAATTDPEERRRLREQACRELRTRSRELARYLDAERTLGVAVLAVPDAVYEVTRSVHSEGFRDGTLIVPYSLTLSYVLALYRLSVRFGAAHHSAPLAESVRDLQAALASLEEEVEGRLSRGLIQAGNARDAVRALVARSRRASSMLFVEED